MNESEEVGFGREREWSEEVNACGS